MTTNSIPPNRSVAPLWIIAGALATIALCLVAVVLRMWVRHETAAASEVAFAIPSQVRPLEREADRAGRKSGMVVRSDLEPPGFAASVENVSVETKADIPETMVVGNRFFGGPPILQSDPAPAPDQTAKPNGSIVGQVSLLSAPPLEMPIDVGGDSHCADPSGRPLTTQRFVVGTNGELADVLVYLKTGATDGAPATRPASNVLQFAGCRITPYVSAMTRYQILLIRNPDAALHNPRVELETNRLRDHALGKGMSSPTIRFPETGLFKRVSCSLHPWEFAYVSVLANPFFAVTDREGRFAITNVPPGDYVIEAIHRKAHGTNGITQSIKLAAGETVTVDFEVRLSDTPLAARGYTEKAR